MTIYGLWDGITKQVIAYYRFRLDAEKELVVLRTKNQSVIQIRTDLNQTESFVIPITLE